MKKKRAYRKNEAPRLTREDWVTAAVETLIQEGVTNVRVDRLAKAFKVTRGSFYWHFECRDDLLNAILEHWRTTNTEPMLRAIAQATGQDRNAFDLVAKLWIDEHAYRPAYDSAMRDWARVDPVVAAAVRQIDDSRIAALAAMFRGYGFADDAALVRARVTYFHQVGYYALAIRETTEERLRLLPQYSKILLE